MAFWQVGNPEAPAAAPRRKPPPQAAATGARGCDACSLQPSWTTLTSPRMPVENTSGDILVIGEAPGAEEDQRGRPFVGPAGQVLRKALPGRYGDRLAMTNMLRCRPPGNRTPSARELHCCSLHLEDDIAQGDYKAILGLGGTPLSWFIEGASITQIHGLKFPVEVAGKTLWYYPTFHPSFVARQRSAGQQSPAQPVFEQDITTFFKQVDRWPPPRIERPNLADVTCAYDEDTARRLCARLDPRIGLDIETTGLRPHAVGAAILTAAVSDGTTTVAWPVNHPQQPTDWGLALLLEVARTHRFIAHNAGFELVWLHEAGAQGLAFEPAAGFDDSMAAARLYQRRESCLNLGILTRIYTGTNIKRLSQVSTDRLAHERLADVLPYNGLDAWGSWRIYQQLARHVDSNAYDTIIATIASTVEMQALGLDVDYDAVQALGQAWEERAASAALHAKTLYEVRQYERARQREFNLGSPEQVGDALASFGRIKLPLNSDQTYKTDDQTLHQLADDNPLAQAALEYRHARKIVSTYVHPLAQAERRFADRRIHPCYTTMLTRTFRTSCEDPNIQNFPKRRDREVRRPIVPPPGCVWASADYGQLEARVYAMASQDRALCQSIIDNEDIHSYWLNVILQEYPPYYDRLAQKVSPNETEADLRKGGRDIIKSDLVFASLYGSTARNVVERTGLPMAVADNILGRFWTRYKGAARWLSARRREYADYGTTRNLFGVVRYGLMNGNEPINTPIQGTAARLVLDAQNDMHALYREHGDPHMMPRINIHDDLTFALPDDDELLVVYIQEISKVLVKVRYPFQIVPLKVEWKVGENWAELYDVFEYTGDYVR